MKKEIIDGYELYSEDGNFKKIVFKDSFDNEVSIQIDEKLSNEFIRRRREDFRDDYILRKHTDTFIYNDYLIEIKTSNHSTSLEDEIFNNNTYSEIIKEIRKLPEPQNRRVYMYLIKGLKNKEIAEIENKNKSVISRSINAGIKKIKKNLKNFNFTSNKWRLDYFI